MNDMKRYIITLICLLFVSGIAAGALSSNNRNATWAQPAAVQGVPNLHKVSDDLYRSAQPTAEGMKNLKKLGIKTIVSLRSYHSDRDEIGTTDLGYVHIPMQSWNPKTEAVVRFLQIVTNPEKTPVILHCQHGADRTGTLSALYRIIIQGWTREEAIEEMKEGGFGFHAIWFNLPWWIWNLDIEKINKQIDGDPKTSADVIKGHQYCLREGER
ncbi:MAG: dual specificity protein phosphatase family protein [Deltaproteobacteria bacterium]|nr:dual specificity protein phosphatase family protein [Deltaproteobacteria bacterium]